MVSVCSRTPRKRSISAAGFHAVAFAPCTAREIAPSMAFATDRTSGLLSIISVLENSAAQFTQLLGSPEGIERGNPVAAFQAGINALQRVANRLSDPSLP